MAYRARLLEEHAEISSRKRQIISGLAEQWASLYHVQPIDLEGSPVPSGLFGPKRPRASAGQLAPEVARALRLDDIWRQCSILLLKKLWQSKHAPPFQQPVDPIALNILDYYNYVTKPMDLRTIKERMAAMHYRTPLDFRDDVRQVCGGGSACAGGRAHGRAMRRSLPSLSSVLSI